MKIRVRHTTRYRFSEPLLYSVQTLHLWPLSSVCQTVEAWRIQTPATLYLQPEGLGNRVHSYSLVATPRQNVLASEVSSEGIVVTHGVAVFEDAGSVPLPAFYLRSTPLSEAHAGMAAWVRSVAPELAQGIVRGLPPQLDQLLALARAVSHKVRYRSGSTAVDTTARQAFDGGTGVCQDQAHVMVALCRSLGLPARYVSGYFYAASEPDLASHAWADVCLDVPARRWVGIDVTHFCPTDERHVRVAAGTDYMACPPIRGLRRGGGEEALSVEVDIRPWVPGDGSMAAWQVSGERAG